jgi:penicillin amidase
VGPEIGDPPSEDAAATLKRQLLEPVIARALDSLRVRLGPDTSQWRWGRFNTSQLPHTLVKAYDIPPVERHGGGGFVAAVGATYREIIDMNDLDRSVATNAPGQSGQPGSPFYANLVASYGRGEYFPLLYSRTAVEKEAAHRLMLVRAP